MKYVACYCRVSTDEQKKFGFSIQAQKDALEKYCKINNYKYEFYIDEGISASSMKKREALNEMLNKCNVYDMILFTKLDRLSRNVLDANTINKILQNNNCTMKAIDEEDIDTTTADGTFIFNLKVSLAQREIEKTSERINFVFKNKRERGEVTSGTKKYGYDIINKKFEINTKEAENIINLYKYFIIVNGNIAETYKYFIKHFNGKGQDALYKYLRETSYIGKYKLYRKNIYIDNYIPRIMDDELFNSVQNLLKKAEKKSNRITVPSIFTGIIRCGICNHRMCRSQDTRGKKNIIRYICDNSSRRKVGSMEYKCSNHKSIREEYIENYLLQKAKTLAQEYVISNTIIPTHQEQKDLSKEIQIIEKKIYKLKDLYLDDLIDKNSYIYDYNSLNHKLNELKKQTTVVKKNDFSNLKKFINTDLDSIYKKLSVDEKRNLWLNTIDNIIVIDGQIKEITFL